VLACVAVIGVGSLDGSPLGRWPGLGALALCTGAAFLLDDAAAVTVAAAPMSLGRRRMLRVALALPLLCGIWAAALWYATTGHGTWSAPGMRAELSLQFASMLMVTLAGSAIALRVADDEHGGWRGVVVPFALLGAVYCLPERWALFTIPGDRSWDAVQHRWAALLATAVLVLVWASRDPAARFAVRRLVAQRS
jgi:hypothetical protein